MGEKKRLSREEIAAIEVGRTDVSPVVAGVMISIFLTIIVSVPIVQNLLELQREDRKQRATVQMASFAAARYLPQCCDVVRILPRGEELKSLDSFDALATLNSRMLRDISTFEDDLEENSLLQKKLIPPAQCVLTGWLRAGNEKAYCGREGWLFYRPGIDYLVGRGFLDPTVLKERGQAGSEWKAPPQPDPVKGIVHFKEQLAKRGVELIIVPTPVKPQIYPELFSRRFAYTETALQNPSFAEFARRVEAAGVKVFDPAPLLMALKRVSSVPMYLETDTHWSPEGMNHVAEELARVLSRSGLNASANTSYTRHPMVVRNHGDISAMLKLPDDQKYFGTQEVTVNQVRMPDGKPWEPNEYSDVLLLGDSFSNIFSLGGMNWGESAGFVEQLSYALKRPIDRLVINDHGAFASRQLLAHELLRGNDRLLGKKVVVWQFAARELSVGDWRLIDLKLRKRSRPNPSPEAPAEVEIEGNVLAVTRPPVPGKVPYKDALAAAHLTELKVLKGKLDADELLIYAWVMRDNRLTGAANWTPGARINLRLTSWEKAKKKYGRYNRRELDDPMVLILDAYWAEQTGEAR